MNKPNFNNLKVWPHLTIIAVICALVAGVAVGWWVRHERIASANALPNAARIQRVDGNVALNNSVASSDPSDENWVTATANQPFTVGDRIYTRENSHASLAFTGRNFARLNPNTSLDVLSLANERTQLALRDGSAMFDVGYLEPGELFEVATPYGAVDLQQPGLYDVGIDNGSVLVSVLSGLAQVAGLGGNGQISKGEVLRLVGQTAADVVLSRIDGGNAGYLVDDYYGYQYPQYYDGRYRDYNAYLDDPYYFDPYRRTTSYQYVNSYVPGLSDLDYYGNWQNLDGYGNAWCPRVDTGWAPYQDGYWMTDYPYGPTWVSSEPWGYAPYHYGRWVNVGNQWFWLPESISNTPTYSPALVAFLPLAQNEIGWVPLGPGDPYSPRYYNSDWNPYYLNNTANVQSRVANLYVPGAVTVVPIDDFARGIDLRRSRKADRQMLASVNPVLDPLTLTPLRNAVIRSAWGRGKTDLPPGIAKKLADTRVVTSQVPVAPPFKKDFARAMQFESVNSRFKNRKFNVKDERGPKGPPPQAQAPNQIRPGDRERQNEYPRVNSEQGRGRKDNENRKAQIDRAMQQVQAERAARAAQQPQGQRVGRGAQAPVRKEIMRQQTPAARKEPGNIRVARPPLPIHQPAARPVERPRPQAKERGGRPVSNLGPPQQMRPPTPRVDVPRARPGKGQPGQSQQKVERQKPQASQPGGGGGKGKGRKP